MASQPYLGAIFLFAGNFAPRGFMFCQGQTLAVNQYAALFAILGTTYGGNGSTTFQLPNLTARAPIGVGPAGGGLPQVVEGQVGGSPTATILVSNMPPHLHTVGQSSSAAAATLSTPTTTSVLASANDPNTGNPFNVYVPGPGTITSAPVNSSIVGSGVPLATQSPYLGLYYIIATVGIFPTRN